ncbi:hypothetical protein SLS53_001646 [Cytospora paraplurivora]|uniref:Spherulin-4 n=1 Tax=Cytospora paraplurivora TaxID=2898453 RepID=A0AAN9YLN8_9PEZI
MALDPGSKLPPTPIINKPFILLPLYIYPTPTAWEPLYSAADSHPELDFLAVVNPGNGPGPNTLPDANYIDALARLTALPNVRLIGYVHCSYGNRPIDELVADVSAYRGWTEAASRRDDGKTIFVDGIFIDEVPSSTVFVQYLATLSRAAKTILNRNLAINVTNKEDPDETMADDADVILLSPTSTTSTPPPSLPPLLQSVPGTASPSCSTAIVIYNPGVVIDPIFYQAADYVVAFEDHSRRWTSPDVRQRLARLPRPLRERSIAVAHSTAGGVKEVGQLSRKCLELGCSGVFVTTQPGYTDWCPFWAEFVRDIAQRTMI